VSVALFDLGQRLHAAALRQPVARSAFAPVLPPVNPVAVIVSGSGEHVLVRASDGTRQTVATGASALAALDELGISTEGEPRTLVVADHDTLGRLLEVALAADPASPSSAAAPVVGWWAMRADHPGTGAVLNATAACSARWVLGVAPSDERGLPTWRRWLGVGDRGPRGLLDVAALVANGTTLPGLEPSSKTIAIRGTRWSRACTIRKEPGTGAGATAAAKPPSDWRAAATRPSCGKACGWATHWWQPVKRSRAPLSPVW
jgi:hypothetical protein